MSHHDPWAGFTSKPWNPDELRAEREAWQAKFGPKLRERDRRQEEQREAARKVFAQLSADQQTALAPFYSLATTTPHKDENHAG